MRGTDAMSFTRYDLRNADERIAQVRTYAHRERIRLDQLKQDSPDAEWIEKVLAAMERTLRQFQQHRTRIVDELKDVEGLPECSDIPEAVSAAR
jgi:hypothetical protein